MSEREQFEAWAKEFAPSTPLWTDNQGQYVYWFSEWAAWQAARAQPAQAGQVSEPLGIGQIAGLVDAAQEPMLKDVVSLCETIRYMVGIAERGSGRKCPDDMQPEMFLLAYVKQLEAMQPQGNAVQVLEFVAQHKSSDWPERCQQMVDMARAALSAAPAQAGQVLTDAEIAAEIRSRGQMVNGVKGDGFMQGARWAEQSVLARVARVPMTPEETDAAMKLLFYPARNRAFVDGVEAAERHHGIVGEKGGA